MRDRSSFLGSRVARRVFWLFVASALLPLALSDWLATSVVSELARSLQERSQTRATRQTALQVFDRLAAARGTLELLAASAVVPSGPGADSRQRTRDEQIFDRLARVDGALADRGDGRDLLDSWRRAGDGAEGASRIPRADGDGVTTVSLRVAVPTGDSPQVLMASSQGGTIRWVGELRPSYLWSPVVQSVIDSGWLVTDSHGRVLARHGDDGLIPAAGETSAETRDAGTIHRTSLFLGADFAAGDWVFTQQTLPTEALWHGAPLGRWLAMVAGGTLLMIALVSLGQIRRILVPLEALTLATRRLASGESRTHVEIAGTDEFTALGQSFNEMAARIDEQFRSLAGLASIDRDVLDGAPIETVARRVIEQLVSAHADVAVAILWLDGELEGSLARLVRAPGEAQATLDSASLTADEARAFADLAQDEVTRPTVLSPLASSLPCCDNDHGDVALLPLRWPWFPDRRPAGLRAPEWSGSQWSAGPRPAGWNSQTRQR